MDEGQADMILKDDDLTDAGADRPSALSVKIAEALCVTDFRCIRSDRRDKVAQLQDDVPDLGRDMVKVMDEI